MVARYEELPFNEFVHRPAAAVERLQSVRALRLRRCDASDLALTRADQLELDAFVVDFIARMLTSLIRSAPDVVRGVLGEALPWVAFLPDEDLDQLLSELIPAAQDAASSENLTPIALLLIQWRHAAEIHADPALLEILTGEPSGDVGLVPTPERTVRSEREARRSGTLDGRHQSELRFTDVAAADGSTSPAKPDETSSSL